MKKIIIALIVIALLFTSSACKKKNPQVYKVGYITDTYGLDNTRNKSINNAIEQSFKNYTLSYVVKQPHTITEYKQAAKTLLATDKFDLVISSTIGINDELLSLKKDYPLTKIAVIGEEDKTGSSMCVTFKNEEAGFLAGILAAKTTTSGKVGFIGGYEKDNLAYQAGFIAGAKTINPQIVVVSSYINSFTDPKKAQAVASVQSNQGVDVIFSACGSGIIGINEQASISGFKIIQSAMYDVEDLRNTIAKVNYNYGNAASYVCDALIMGYFKEGVTSLGVSDQVISLNINKKNVSNSIISEYKQYFTQIESYDMKIPKTLQEVNNYNYNQILTQVNGI